MFSVSGVGYTAGSVEERTYGRYLRRLVDDLQNITRRRLEVVIGISLRGRFFHWADYNYTVLHNVLHHSQSEEHHIEV